MTRVVIAGGGIAGLTAALALHRVGCTDITVLERSRSLEPLGAGINLMPQAVRELDRLGVLDDLRRISIETSELIYTTARGEEIWREKRGAAAGFRWPQLSIHRGWLQQCLAEHVRTRLGEATIRTGAHVVDAKTTAEDNAEVSVRYRDRDSGIEQYLHADLIIGSDGIRSAVRPVVVPTDAGPRAVSQIVWRGMAWIPSFMDGRTMVIAGNEDHKVVFYPIADEGGQALVNWAAAGPLDTDDDAEHGNWNLPVEPRSFAPHFEGWHVRGVDVAELIYASGTGFAYPMVDLDPLDRWVQGSIVIIGDAAHAMYPVGSNGATQSIIDGASLAFHLGRSRSVETGLAAFERERLPRCRSIQKSNRRRGPEIVIDLAASRVPRQYTTVVEAFAPGELEAIAARYARTTALDEANTDSPYQIPEIDAEPTTIEWETAT